MNTNLSIDVTNCSGAQVRFRIVGLARFNLVRNKSSKFARLHHSQWWISIMSGHSLNPNGHCLEGLWSRLLKMRRAARLVWIVLPRHLSFEPWHFALECSRQPDFTTVPRSRIKESPRKINKQLVDAMNVGSAPRMAGIGTESDSTSQCRSPCLSWPHGRSSTGKCQESSV